MNIKKHKFPPQNITIAPSILSSDFSRLRSNINILENAGVEVLHLDVMDGHFVPNISFGPAIIKSLRPHSGLVFDTHLMISSPEKYLESFASAGADLITVHLEAVGNSNVKVPDLFSRIRGLGKLTGISINPKTPAEDVYPYLKEADMVLVMSVEPGFGGQKMIPSAIEKIPKIKKYIENNGFKCKIEVDGGINQETISTAAQAGADIIVVGSAIFGKEDIKEAYNSINKIINNT